jgi:hypothetical protein
LRADWADDTKTRRHLDGIPEMWAYLFTVEADAWQRLMADLNIDAETLLRDLPCYDTIRRANEITRLLAFTEQQAVEFLRKRGTEGPPLTVETVLAEMRTILHRRAEFWS